MESKLEKRVSNPSILKDILIKLSSGQTRQKNQPNLEKLEPLYQIFQVYSCEAKKFVL
jgi:hypothetical protein